MKRIFSTSLLMLAICAQAFGQGGRQLPAQSLVKATDVTSIPLSDTLPEKVKSPERALEKSRRDASIADPRSLATGEKRRYWVRPEYLNWRIKGSYLPPLVQVFRFPQGNLERGEVLVGDREVNPGNSGGGRITAGMWLNQQRTIGVEASYFYLGPRSINQGAGGTGAVSTEDIGRPFNPLFFGPSFFPLSRSSLARGDLAASLASHLQGAELNALYAWDKPGCCPLRLIGGLRFLDFKERLTIIQNLMHNNVGPLGTPSDRLYVITDEFATRNRFYGGQAGVETEFERGRLRLELSGKVALGGVRQLVNISGSTFLPNPIASSITGGFLALETNIGRYERTRLVVLPEAKAGIGYQVTDNLAAFAGYDFLYLSGVARPTELIDLGINWVRIPFYRITFQPTEPGGGPNRPAFLFSDSPFWARGLTVGMRLGF